MSFNPLEFIIDVRTRGAAALDEIAQKVRAQIALDGMSAENTEKFGKMIENSLKARVMAYKDLDEAMKSSAMTALQSMNAETAALVQMQLAARAAAQAVTDGADQGANAFGKFGGVVGQVATKIGGLPAMFSSVLGSFATGGLIGGVVIGFTTLSLGAAALASSIGDAAREQYNMSLRTGLTVQEVGQLSGAAQITGVNVNALVSMMRTLTKAMSENTDEGKKGKQALHDVGIDAYDAAGKLKPLGALIQEISAAVRGLSEEKRNDLLLAIGGRGALELVPLLTRDLRDLAAQVEATGSVMTNEGNTSLRQYAESLDKIGLVWDALKLRLATGIVGVITFFRQTSGFDGPTTSQDQYRKDQEDNVPGVRYNRRTRTRSDSDPAAEQAINEARRLANSPRMQALKLLTEAGADISVIGSVTDDNADDVIKQQIAKADGARKRALSSGDTPQEQLRDLQGQLKKAEANVKLGTLGGVDAPAIADVDRLKGLISAKKAQIEGEKEFKQAVTESEAALRRAHESEFTGLERIAAKRDEMLKKYGKIGDTVSGKTGRSPNQTTTDAADIEGTGEALRELERMQKQLATASSKGLPAELGADKEGVLKGLNVMVEALRDKVRQGVSQSLAVSEAEVASFAVRTQQVLRGIKFFEQGEKDAKEFLNTLDAATARIAKSVAEDTKRLNEANAPDKGRLEAQRGELRDQLSRNEKLALLNNPDQEILQINLVEQLKRKYAEDEQARAMKLAALELNAAKREEEEARAKGVYQKEIDDLALDRAIKIGELRKREMDEFGAAAGRLFDDLKGKGGQGLQTFLKDELNSTIKTLFVNGSKEAFGAAGRPGLSSLVPGQTEVDEHGNTRLTTIGKIFQNTPLGVRPSDQLKDAAVTSNTSAITQNTQAHNPVTTALLRVEAAAMRLVAALSGGRFGGAGSGIAGVSGGDAGAVGPEGVVEGSGLPTDGFPELTGTGSGEADGSSPSASSGPRAAGSYIAGGAAVVGGAAGAVNGFMKGSARGIASGIGSVAAMASGVLDIVSKIAGADPDPTSKMVLMGIALAGQLFGMLGPDPKKQFAKDQDNTLIGARYTAPDSAFAGRQFSIDDGSQLTYNFQYQQSRLAQSQAAKSAASSLTINLHVQAMDSKNIISHSQSIGDAMVKAIGQDHPVRRAIQQTFATI